MVLSLCQIVTIHVAFSKVKTLLIILSNQCQIHIITITRGFFLLLPSDDRLDSVGIDPADEGRDASEHVGHAETARDTPRDNTVEGTALHQRAAGVTHAHALAGRAQRTDGRVEDAASVGFFSDM